MTNEKTPRQPPAFAVRAVQWLHSRLTGLEFTRVIRTAGMLCIVEAKKTAHTEMRAAA